MTMIETERLILRQWRDSDRAPFAALNADPAVMEFMPGRLTREQSDGMIEHFRTMLETKGMTFYALEERETGALIGAAGLFPVTKLPFAPAVEIGWRLRAQSWGRGYASEAARAALAEGFGRLGLDEIVAYTAALNVRSQRVMERIGMTRDAAGDFDHPALPEGSPLRRHVLYRLPRQRWADPVGTAT
ncbi:MAG: GNAT family N-acetyltransferase [Rhizobiales bacterium]|nr:GNAT family N-acetyltransferase [Hyphomicrobiales bacterium]